MDPRPSAMNVGHTRDHWEQTPSVKDYTQERQQGGPSDATDFRLGGASSGLVDHYDSAGTGNPLRSIEIAQPRLCHVTFGPCRSGCLISWPAVAERWLVMSKSRAPSW